MSNEERGDKHPEHGEEHQKEHHHEFEIQIDRVHYKVTMERMTGLQLRHVPNPPIGPDRDLFEVVPGGSDRKIGDEQVVEIRNLGTAHIHVLDIKSFSDYSPPMSDRRLSIPRQLGNGDHG
jgi:hypothetical protein